MFGRRRREAEAMQAAARNITRAYATPRVDPAERERLAAYRAAERQHAILARVLCVVAGLFTVALVGMVGGILWGFLGPLGGIMAGLAGVPPLSWIVSRWKEAKP